MPINAIGSATTAQNLQSNGLGMQDFLKILLTQLTYQDPLKPVDNQQFMAQMAQFTSLQQTQQLNTKIDQLINNQASLQSVGLIGRTVEVAANGSTFNGVVSSLSLSGTTPLLSITMLDGSKVDNIGLGQINSVK